MPATLDQKLSIDRTFSSAGCCPFDEISWRTTTAEITGDNGAVIFRQTGVEVPEFWSDLAVKVVVSKYFYGEVGQPERETSVRQLITRVARTISAWAVQDGYIDDSDSNILFDELCWLLLNQHGAFNSPVWFNVGVHAHQQLHEIRPSNDKGMWRWNKEEEAVDRSKTQYDPPQVSACFIQPVADTMEGIMDLAKSEAMLFKFGSGTGTNLSTLRSTREKLTGGGSPSGPLSFLKIYDAAAGVIQSGGKTRRAAKMKEEKKAHALIDQGYDGNFNGEAYATIAFQNENLSVLVSDDFMEAAIEGRTWTTKHVTDGSPCEDKDASALLDKIAEGAHTCGDPGMQFDTAIQEWHTCKDTGRINATNPCSEYVFLDDTACNLASLNLAKFMDGDEFNCERFQAAVRIFILAQDVLVDNASYPTANIAENSHIFRTLGLGYANLGAVLMRLGIPYDSDKGRVFAAYVTALMTGAAYRQSIEVAKVKGTFVGYGDSRDAVTKRTTGSQPYTNNRDSMLNVLKGHRQALLGKSLTSDCFGPIFTAAEDAWNATVEAVEQGHGPRNAQVTVLAPTGTISFLMDCDTTGIEPDIALVKYKSLAGRGMLKLVNQSVEASLAKLGYEPSEIRGILEYIEENDTIESAPGFRAKDLPVFDCAFQAAKGTRSIPHTGHLRMMAAAQPFISGAISKTVNLPNTCSIEDVREAYIMAWKLKLKCVAVYRDGSKRSQPLNTSKDSASGAMPEEEMKSHLRASGYEVVDKEFIKDKEEEVAMLRAEVAAVASALPPLPAPIPVEVTTAGTPQRTRLPDTRNAITHKFMVGGHKGYLTVGMYDDGTPGELFVSMAKEGSTIGGLMDSIATMMSIALQYGVPVEVICNKFRHQRFEPSGWSGNKEIGHASSIIDYVAAWLEIQFVGKEKNELPAHIVEDIVEEAAYIAARVKSPGDVARQFQSDAPPCPTCGHITIQSGNCHKCANCGESVGCS